MIRVESRSGTQNEEMNLDLQAYPRDRLTRAPRVGGKVFLGVVGSGVYCRPISPAPIAKEKSIR
jgi:methylphosphotriester-DNA--protein-cysteine methyltransferase